jgi:small ligand-binding sensory domain FIST
MSIRFHSAISDHEASDEAIGAVIDDAQRQLDSADVAFLFFTTHHRDSAEEMAEKILLEFSPKALVACTCEGVIGQDREIERSPGISLFLGQVPEVSAKPFHISTDEWRTMIEDRAALSEKIGIADTTRAIIGFGDPWTTPLTQFMQALDETAPQAPLIGGMASGARSPGGNLLACNDALVDDGFVGVSLSGAIDVQTIVSQGCKPIGSPLVVTKAKENIIEQLGGKPAMIVLRDIVNALSPVDQELLQHGLLLGRAISEYRDTFMRGDFLVRNLAGADQETGAISVADYVRVGQTVQFHVRDAATADEDLSLMLSADRIGNAPAGALLFSCNGRGSQLFDSPNHDIAVSRQKMPGTPVGGFFAAGEIGPVGGKNFIHGHTASFALFRAPGAR